MRRSSFLFWFCFYFLSFPQLISGRSRWCLCVCMYVGEGDDGVTPLRSIDGLHDPDFLFRPL